LLAPGSHPPDEQDQKFPQGFHQAADGLFDLVYFVQAFLRALGHRLISPFNGCRVAS
jgi:hypothetical protein